MQYNGSLETRQLQRHEPVHQGITLTVSDTDIAAQSHKPQCVLSSRVLPQMGRTKELKGCSVQKASPHLWQGLQIQPWCCLFELLLSPSEGCAGHCHCAHLLQTGQGTALMFFPSFIPFLQPDLIFTLFSYPSRNQGNACQCCTLNHMMMASGAGSTAFEMHEPYCNVIFFVKYLVLSTGIYTYKAPGLSPVRVVGIYFWHHSSALFYRG